MKLVDGNEKATIDETDLKPFAAAVQWWHNKYNLDGKIPRPQILCVSDSPGIVAAGKTPELRGDVMTSDWRFIDWFERRGYRIDWFWESRDDHPAVIAEATAVQEKIRANNRAVQAPVTQ